MACCLFIAAWVSGCAQQPAQSPEQSAALHSKPTLAGGLDPTQSSTPSLVAPDKGHGVASSDPALVLRSSRRLRTTTEPPAAVVVNKSAVTSYELTEPSATDADDGLNDDDEEDEEFLGTLVGTGVASWYGGKFHGRLTASGERFNRMDLTAAHKSLPFGTRVCVRNVSTGKTVLVRINDRGPFAPGRVIDLSQAAAQELGIQGLGIKPVELYKMHGKDDTCPDELLTAGTRLDVADGESEANGTGKRMVLPANAVKPAALRSSKAAANKRDARKSATSDSRPTRKARPAKSPRR